MYLSAAIASKLKIDPSRDRMNMESMASSSFFSKSPWRVRYPILHKMIKMFSRVLYKLPNMSEMAKLQMKKYMGKCKFLFLTTAIRISRFSSIPAAATVKKTSSGTMTWVQSVIFNEKSLMFWRDGMLVCPGCLIKSEGLSVLILLVVERVWVASFSGLAFFWSWPSFDQGFLLYLEQF